MGLPVVLPQQIPTEITVEIPPHGVDVIGIVLHVVVRHTATAVGIYDCTDGFQSGLKSTYRQNWGRYAACLQIIFNGFGKNVGPIEEIRDFRCYQQKTKEDRHHSFLSVIADSFHGKYYCKPNQGNDQKTYQVLGSEHLIMIWIHMARLPGYFIIRMRTSTSGSSFISCSKIEVSVSP